ncbi:response regulator [Pseudonocardia abyssalis]|jgi:CheY-like chemotaxis protein|uniref:Response regulator n=1 Tax=Pseudonocardia abyssalis TaxID=2792008 RepID=A0ABS6UYD9_9PSEU|nr:response regulator [Pseudonocardia abyssalis]MBW0116732.1 response regulator [Pseudonocardia abyssalis]MBW0137244.1 response regulator [Pseudonocardia abyssalis]
MTDLVLMIEDSAEDVEAVQRTMARSYPTTELEAIADGRRALDRLLDDTVGRPDVVLLDLNLPGVDGRSVLSEIRGRPELADLVVVVLTSSTDPRDVEQCYRAGANGYVFKPVDYAMFCAALCGALDYWLPHGGAVTA